jgi:hypothetical protein
MQSAN